jgi:hypothetical protein
LQFAELLGESSLRDSGNGAFELGESFGAMEKLIENCSFPASADNPESRFYRTDLRPLHHLLLGVKLYTK